MSNQLLNIKYNYSFIVKRIDIESMSDSEMQQMKLDIFGSTSRHVGNSRVPSCFGSEYCFLGKSQFDHLKEVYDGIVYGMKFAHTYIGYTNIKRNGTNATMNALCIVPEFQSRGYGKLFMRKVICKLKKKGVTRLQFSILKDDDANRRLAFYSTLGRITEESATKKLTIHSLVLQDD